MQNFFGRSNSIKGRFVHPKLSCLMIYYIILYDAIQNFFIQSWLRCQNYMSIFNFVPSKKLLAKSASSFMMFDKSYCNFSISILLIMPGFALPLVAFMI